MVNQVHPGSAKYAKPRSHGGPATEPPSQMILQCPTEPLDKCVGFLPLEKSCRERGGKGPSCWPMLAVNEPRTTPYLDGGVAPHFHLPSLVLTGAPYVQLKTAAQQESRFDSCPGTRSLRYWTFRVLWRPSLSGCIEQQEGPALALPSPLAITANSRVGSENIPNPGVPEVCLFLTMRPLRWTRCGLE